jgi:hypothetical protein
MSSSAGPIIVVVGIVIVVLGLLAWTGGLGWFGRLPGDIRYERGSTRVYAPFATMLLISVVLSLVGFFLRRR